MAILIIMVLNSCPLESFYILAQDMDGESRISKDGRILEINTFSRCLENVGFFSVLLFFRVFLCAYHCFSVFIGKPLGEGRVCFWARKIT